MITWCWWTSHHHHHHTHTIVLDKVSLLWFAGTQAKLCTVHKPGLEREQLKSGWMTGPLIKCSGSQELLWLQAHVLPVIIKVANSKPCYWSKGEMLNLIASLCALPCADRQILSRHMQHRLSTHRLHEHCSGQSGVVGLGTKALHVHLCPFIQMPVSHHSGNS